MPLPLTLGLPNFGSLDELIVWGGYAVLFIIIFAETGLFVGFLLPGDSLIITAGLVAASGKLDLLTVILVMTAAAILGDATGYAIGKGLGVSLFRKKDSIFFRRDYLLKAQTFYSKHGGKTIFFARFVPLVRSFATTVAGAAAMPFASFLFFSVTGAVCWVVSFALLGYFLGALFPELTAYINAIIAVGVVLIASNIVYRIFAAKKNINPSK
jgi:membrane-associated protein